MKEPELEVEAAQATPGSEALVPAQALLVPPQAKVRASVVRLPGQWFIVATANDITALPPELVRKGRFDEIFFVDLPTPAARAEIFGIHCKKRGIALPEADIKTLVARSEGFSGAEIEQAVVSALYAAHAGNGKADARLIAAELAATRPLSVVMAERIAELRDWAARRETYIEEQASRLIAREQELAAVERHTANQRQQWDEERRNLQTEIRRLQAHVRRTQWQAA